MNPRPDRHFVLDRLEIARDRIPPLRQEKRFSHAFQEWKRNTAVLLRNAFGDESSHANDFNKIAFSVSFAWSDMPDKVYQDAYLAGLESADAMLASIITEVHDFWPEEPVSPSSSARDVVERLADRFHTVTKQLRLRYNKRGTIDVDDEYDVQDLLHALLRIWFDDVRAEEWTPSYAGGSSRVDFLLKEERTVIEVKMTRKSLSARKLGEELIIDIERYRAHPDCGRLICFVYDPAGLIPNSVGLASDLSGQRDDLDVDVFIRPK